MGRFETVTAGFAAGAVFMLGGCGSEGNKVSENPVSPRDYAVPAEAQVILNPANMCEWSPQNPQPQKGEDQWQIDGRCGFPMPPSGFPEDDTPRGVYLVPRQDSNKIAATVTSGDIVQATCYTEGGATVIDGKDRKSNVWVAIVTAGGKEGIIPAFVSGYAIPSKKCTKDDLRRIAQGAPIA